MEIRLTVNKADVYNEVAMTTSYTGAKMDDATAYERIFTTDEDKEQLERFWSEVCAEACQSLMRLMAGDETNEADFKVKLRVSEAFDESLQPSMGKSLRSYFVQGISGRWFMLTNKGEATAYIESSLRMLEDVRRKAFMKMRPRIPSRYAR